MLSYARKHIDWIFLSILLSLSLTVLFGWFLDLELLKRISPNYTAMSPLAALLFLLLGFSILFSQFEARKSLYRYTAIILSLVVSIVSLIRIADIFFGNSLNIDLIFLQEKLLVSENPARMAMATSLCFLFISTFYVLHLLFQKIYKITHILLFLSLIISSSALIFYLFSGDVFLRTTLFSSMAIHTATGFLFALFSTAVYLRREYKIKPVIADLRFLVLLSLVVIPFWVFEVSPEITKLQNDFEYSAEIFSIDNLYNEEIGDYTGEIRSNTTFSYQVESSQNGILNIKNIFDVRNPNTGEQIFSVERLYAVDQYTGEHVPGYGDADRNGYLFAPRNLKKEEFLYWHINYDQPILMRYEEDEEISGINTYHYISEFQTDQTQNLTNLPGVGKNLGINLDVTLELWIEPLTGHLVKYEDSAIAYYYDLKTKERLYPWNKFSNRYSTSAIQEQISIVQQKIFTNVLVEKLIPIALAVLALISIIAYILKKYKNISPLSYTPLLLFFIGMSTTYFVWRNTHESLVQQSKTRFENDIADIEELITERLYLYEGALKGARGLLESSTDVNRDEWKIYTNSLELQKNYPGIQGVGYSIVLEPEDVNTFEENVQAEGFPDFSVTPKGERSIYTSILFLEPFDFRNQRAFGYDMFSQVTRRNAMEYARDNGTTSITGKVTLLQETEDEIQAGFLMYVPYYGVEDKSVNENQREEAINGYVYSPFRMNDFMRGLLFNHDYDIDIEIYDGDIGRDFSEETEMYDKDKGEYSKDINYNPDFDKVRVLDIYNNQWTIRYLSLPGYGLGSLQESYPELILRIGIVFTVLLSLAVYVLSTSRSRAINLARNITKELKTKNKELSSFNSKLEKEIIERKNADKVLREKSNELERMNRLMVDRELKMVELKKLIKK